MSFTLTSVIVFSFLGLTWNHDNLTNWAFKFGFIALAFWGASVYF